ncbi:retrovirus-related pol polyprotein from transposon TNT 1-94 [Tanacetum coccineum]|uniref:Retrovirus-related pol polyprotein from transposon TNT 1-94 n=1 Tax=Tanacetum coccineum TaxID=301880 RepID=A0ABQ5I7Z5_9ASTR
MTTLAKFMIIFGVDNRSPMLEKSMYVSWKSRMKLYIENRENGRRILNSVLNGPLVWPTIIEENGTTRTKKYEELSVAEKLLADCDLKATNIVLQDLPPDVYAIVNHHKVSKEIWDRVKLLMQGNKLSLQEKKCKLYDEFDKFSFVKGETLYQYYWRFAQLINNMNIINMSMRPVQLSHLNFGTLNKLAKDSLARGILKLKFKKDHLCSACALGKSKKSSHQPKVKDTNQEKLYLLHMDLCGLMRLESINGKSTSCIQVRLNATVRNVRTDNGTEFVNQTLCEFYENVGISHQTSVARTPQQNSVVERQNQTLVEAARTMLIFLKALLFL